mmetsp:Transcript_17750/g.44948  ORF Transcript_17750/g.44948 Transcript_17750/m.44948 type:complete len:716 (+) Transcript_17750:32-2179(+)
MLLPPHGTTHGTSLAIQTSGVAGWTPLAAQRRPLQPQRLFSSDGLGSACTVAGVAVVCCKVGRARWPSRRRGWRRRRLTIEAAGNDRIPSPSANGDDSAEQQVQDLERALKRLMADNVQLREELRRQNPQASSSCLSDVAAKASETGRETKSAASLEAPADDWGPFNFPEADLPWPLEFLRVTAPGASDQRDACGDWLSLFRNAAPYIAAFRGGAAVVHVPSFMLDEPERENFKGLMEDVAFCSLLGLQCVVVASIEDRLLRRLQKDERYMERLDGITVGNRLRGLVLDEEALRIAKQEAGLARVEVESALSAGFEKRATSTPSGANGQATSTSAGIFPVRGAVSVVSSTNFFSASPMGVRDGVDYGYAGIVRSVNTELIARRLSDGDIVSLTPLGASPSGEVFFVSSEELAAVVAKKLRAIKLVYITRGQRLIDVRDEHVMAGIQLHDATDLLHHLNQPEGLARYSPEVCESVWFTDFIRHLGRLCSAVDPKGVRRGHLVDPRPGALLQEFYTTDGSGTVVAQDLYQGLGRATLGDAPAIRELLVEDARSQGLDPEECRSVPALASVEAGCASGEFFVWRRDEVVLGCGQLLVVCGVNDRPVAELRCLAVAAGQHDTHASALLGYAERAAAGGGAAWLAAPASEGRVAWFQKRGFHKPTEAQRASLPFLIIASSDSDADPTMLLKSLDVGAVSKAEEAIAQFAEDQRMWGGTEL